MKRPVRRSIVVACVSAALLIASADCAPRASIEGRPCPCADGYRCCGPADVCVGAAEACPASVIASAATVAKICAVDHGPALGPPRTAAAFSRFLGRRWFPCRFDVRSPSSLVAHEGIEFGGDGTWSFLRSTESGYERMTTAADRGTYEVWNDTLTAPVKWSDTTPGHDLHLVWTESKGALTLYFDFEHTPLRFRTTNGIELWFVAEGGDGTELIGDEGASCESDHSICKPGSNCVSERNAEMCARPATDLPAGEGCDNRGTRTCAPELVCRSDTRQCGIASP
jgi:hypothetical protein